MYIDCGTFTEGTSKIRSLSSDIYGPDLISKTVSS